MANGTDDKDEESDIALSDPDLVLAAAASSGGNGTGGRTGEGPPVLTLGAFVRSLGGLLFGPPMHRARFLFKVSAPLHVYALPSVFKVAY